MLVHHCHREQWPVAGPVLGRIGWFVESRLSPRVNRRNQYVTVSLPSARDLVALGVDNERIAVVRNGLDEAPAHTLAGPPGRPHRGWWCCRGWCRTSRSRMRWRRSPSCDRGYPACISTSSATDGGDSGSSTTSQRLGISDAVTFHGHVDDVTKHHVLQQLLGACTAVAQGGLGSGGRRGGPAHGCPTIGYRSSGGLSDSIIDGVTGILVDNHAELVDRLEQLLTDPVLREQLGAKAQVRSGEFSWAQSADAMRTVLEAVHTGDVIVGGVI